MTEEVAMPYTVITHPRSGERFAVELDGADQIIRAAGPLHYNTPTDAETLRDYIDHDTAIRDYINNQDSGDVEADAAWLRDELSFFHSGS
jgi:hypothetical protein